MTGAPLLKDQLFNAQTVERLAGEYAAAVPGFDAARFVREALAGFACRELMARIDWLATCLAAQLAPDFPTMAAQIEAALPPPLDPARRDDDFGQFIHAVPGVLAVRYGLEAHRERALDLLHAATQRFSMEYALRPFLIRWPEQTLARLAIWADDPNYHVRRLVSEGSRPRLPWGKAVGLTPARTLPLLDHLYADPARFVTRSVANHLNDISKSDPEAVLARLAAWQAEGRQSKAELAWMTRHALRSVIKQGHPGALEALGYRRDAPVRAKLVGVPDRVQTGGALPIEIVLEAERDCPVLVDLVIWFRKANGKTAPKVFKVKTANLRAGEALVLHKTHVLRPGTTVALYPGPHRLGVQVNGTLRAEAAFDLV